MKIKKALALLGVAACSLMLALYLHRGPAWEARAEAAEPPAPGNVARLWLNRPDVVIRSQSLTDLPKDALQVPLLKDVLTEDLLFYYDTDEDWLGLKGSLRRIAYEHDLDLSDHLLSLLLDRPADVYLWRDDKGALRHYAMVLQGNALTALAESVAKIVLAGDRQLRQIGQFSVSGSNVPLYSLHLSPRRSYVIAFYQDRLLLLSSADLALKADNPQAASGDSSNAHPLDTGFVDTATHWLAPQEKDRISIFSDYQLPADSGSKHSVLVSSRFISQGYSSFVPGITALRFDFNGTQWSTQGLLDMPANPSDRLNATIWQHVPVNAAACVLAPANWPALERYLPDDGNFSKTAARKIDGALQGSAVVCWYPEARLYAPLLVASFQPKTGDGVDRSLGQLFDWVAGSSHDKTSGDARHAMKIDKKDGAVLWSRRLPVKSKKENPTLAHVGDTLYFSPDASLIAKALAVQQMRFPAMADTQGNAQAGNSIVLFHTDTARLSTVVDKEVRRTIRDGSDDAQVIDQRLAPRLKALATHGQLDLVLPASGLRAGRQWYPLTWQAE